MSIYRGRKIFARKRRVMFCEYARLCYNQKRIREGDGRKVYRIMIVEDDACIADEMRDALKKWGYEVELIRDFSLVARETAAFGAQLVLMDISLPCFNGYYWCQKIREASSVPVIFVSSRADSMDIVMAVNMGGDDYIVKPFSQEVLVAKTQAILRRAYAYEKEAEIPLSGGTRFDEKAGCLLSAAGDRAQLTRNEGRILALLLRKKGKIVPREEIMLALWDSDEFVDDNTLTVNINRLRKTLEKAGAEGAIVTHKGQGYRLDV